MLTDQQIEVIKLAHKCIKKLYPSSRWTIFMANSIAVILNESTNITFTNDGNTLYIGGQSRYEEAFVTEIEDSLAIGNEFIDQLLSFLGDANADVASTAYAL
jgi:hypothetical protein